MIAKYYPDETGSRTLEVLKDHKDGTVDLGLANGQILVSQCPLVSERKVGCATLIEEKKEAKEKEPKK